MRRMMLLRRGAHVRDALEQIVLERTRAPRQLVGAAQWTAVPRPTLAWIVLCKQTIPHWKQENINEKPSWKSRLFRMPLAKQNLYYLCIVYNFVWDSLGLDGTESYSPLYTYSLLCTNTSSFSFCINVFVCCRKVEIMVRLNGFVYDRLTTCSCCKFS